MFPNILCTVFSFYQVRGDRKPEHVYRDVGLVFRQILASNAKVCVYLFFKINSSNFPGKERGERERINPRTGQEAIRNLHFKQAHTHTIGDLQGQAQQLAKQAFRNREYAALYFTFHSRGQHEENLCKLIFAFIAVGNIFVSYAHVWYSYKTFSTKLEKVTPCNSSYIYIYMYNIIIYK